MTKKDSPDVKPEFERKAYGVAEEFSLDVADVKNAYQEKPKSLSAVFNSMDDSRNGRNRSLGWSVVWLVVFPPAVLITGYNAYRQHEKLGAIREQVADQIRLKRLTDQRESKPPKPE